jgi:phage repressor protein C with HTH and peptisase S24 domain
MSTLQERMALAIKHYEEVTNKKFKNVDLATYANVSRVNVGLWVKGPTEELRGSNLIKAAEFLHVNQRWLAGEKAPMVISNVKNKLSSIGVWDENTPISLDEVEVAFYKTLRLACGSGSMVQVNETDKSYTRVSRKLLDQLGIYRDKTFCAPTEDDSMKPTINDGDIVYVDENRNFIKDGKIFAIEHGDLFRCKRLYKTAEGGVRIVSDNKEEYPEEVLTKQQIQDQKFRVIGWVWKIDKVETW